MLRILRMFKEALPPTCERTWGDYVGRPSNNETVLLADAAVRVQVFCDANPDHRVYRSEPFEYVAEPWTSSGPDQEKPVEFGLSAVPFRDTINYCPSASRLHREKRHMSELENFRMFFDSMGVRYGLWKTDDGEQVLTVSQAHFYFDENETFVRVQDDEMGGVHMRIEGT